MLGLVMFTVCTKTMRKVIDPQYSISFDDLSYSHLIRQRGSVAWKPSLSWRRCLHSTEVSLVKTALRRKGLQIQQTCAVLRGRENKLDILIRKSFLHACRQSGMVSYNEVRIKT